MSKKKRPPREIVYVRWFDAAIAYDLISANDAHGTLEQESAGILVQEDGNSVTIAMDRCKKTGNLRGTLCIPKVNIRSVARFTV